MLHERYSFKLGLKPRVAVGLPINQGHGSVLVPLANVTGAQPPVFREDGLVVIEVIALVVAASNGWSAKEDFTLGWVIGGQVSGVGYVEELDFYGWGGEPHNAILHDIWWKDGAHSASLCHTVTCAALVSLSPRVSKTCDDHTLNNCNQSEVQEFLRLAGQGGTTGQCHAQTTTGRLPNLGKYDRVDDVLQHGHVRLLDRHGAVEHALANSAAPVDLRKDALADKFPNGGNAHHDCRLEGLDITLAVSDGLVRQCLHAAVTAADTNENEAQLDYVFEDMREREEGQKRVVVLEMVADKSHNRTNGSDEVRMLEDDTLGRARGARRVHDTSHVIAGRGAGFREFEWLLAAEFAQGIDRKYGHPFADAVDLG